MPSNVINLFPDQEIRPFVQVVDRAADTSVRPYLCRASDGNYYWCKEYENAQGPEATINEVVSSVIGEKLDAPIREWRFLDVPEKLVGTYIPGSRIRLREGPVFGSLDLHNAEVDLMDIGINFAEKDGNYERIPRLIALWFLTNAQDLQVLFDTNADHSIWSIDHGLWFDSSEVMWRLSPSDIKSGRPEIARPITPIPKVHWDSAITSVSRLDLNLTSEICSLMPQEWEVPQEDIEQLVKYVVRRKSTVKEWLKEQRDKDAWRLAR